jgi:hypothetical protein
LAVSSGSPKAGQNQRLAVITRADKPQKCVKNKERQARRSANPREKVLSPAQRVLRVQQELAETQQRAAEVQQRAEEDVQRAKEALETLELEQLE